METKTSIYSLFKQSCIKNPSSNCLYYMGRYFTRKETLEYINKLAYSLNNLIACQDEKVTICLPNIPQAVFFLYGINQLGLVSNIIHPLSRCDEIKNYMEKVNSKILVCLDIRYKEFKELEKLGYKIIVCSIATYSSLFFKIGYKIKFKDKLDDFSSNCIFYEDLITKNKIETYDDSYLEDRILLHSGGTSGVSKTIRLSNYSLNNLAYQADYILKGIDLNNKHMLAVLPMFHGFGLIMGIHIILVNGACSTLMVKFHSKDVVNLIKKGKINFIIGVPILYEALLKNKDFNGKKLTKIEACFIGGDNVTKSLLERFNSRLEENGSKGKLFQGYGLTEFGTVTNVNTFQFNKIDSVGKPILGIKEKIIDIETKKELPPNKEGEIYISGNTMMNGYIDEDGFIIDENGIKWVNTGDFGYIDEDGYLYFKQRIKRIVKVNGVNVFPYEVENAVSEIEGVYQVACLDKPSEKRGSILDVYIVKNRDYTKQISPEQVKEYIKNKCGVYSIPDKVIFINKMPKTNVGKIDYKKLKDLNS